MTPTPRTRSIEGETAELRPESIPGLCHLYWRTVFRVKMSVPLTIICVFHLIIFTKRPTSSHTRPEFVWARANPASRVLTEGIEGADSWTTDSHKWLNTPTTVRWRSTATRPRSPAAMGSDAVYVLPNPDAQRNLTLEFSRRPRGISIWRRRDARSSRAGHGDRTSRPASSDTS
jgi:hypothetical protein